jgi:hypothetical protein
VNNHFDPSIYSSNDSVRASLANKTLIGVIAPTAVGKSTLISETIRLCSDRGIDAAEVGSITTRPRRSGSDPQNYLTASEGITHENLTARIENQELVNWVASPTGDIYATDVASYPGTFNFLPIIPEALPMIQRAGFRTVKLVYVTVSAALWSKQIGERTSDPKFIGRLDEAISSLEFALSHLEQFHIVHNEYVTDDEQSKPSRAAEQLLAIATEDTPILPVSTESQQYLKEMLTYAQKLREGHR